MIVVKDICKTFKSYRVPSDRLKEIVTRRCYHKQHQVLKSISFEVKSGETLGIIGQNGAGKSTILKVLTGVLMPDSGTVQIDGKITGILELGTGFNPEFSGMNNISYNATCLGLSASEISQRIGQIIAFSELGDYIHEPLKAYSSGMIMRLAFAVAIHADPQAFVVDEALSVGDAYFQQKCIRKIKEFKNKGGSIIFVSHDLNAVKLLCDKAVLLEKGQIVEQGDPEAVINTYNFIIAKRTKGEQITYCDSDRASGYGNHKIKIYNVSLWDRYDQPLQVAISGQPAKIAICLSGQETVDDVTIGMVIRDRFGQDIFGTNTFYWQKPVNVKKGQCINVIYDFREFNIGPGKYSLTVSAHTGDAHLQECFHWLDNGLVFEVVAGAGPVFIGLARLVPEICVQNGSCADAEAMSLT